LAIGVVSRCDARIGFHAKALIRLGVSHEQLTETLAICTYMGGGPTLMCPTEAVRVYEEFLFTVPKVRPDSGNLEADKIFLVCCCSKKILCV